MKALIIGVENEEFDLVRKSIESNYDRSEIIILKKEDDLIEVLTSNGPFSFVSINLDDKHYSATELHEQITDVIGHRPFIFIGTPNACKSQLTNELINNQKTNSVIESPIVPQELKKAIAAALNWIKNEEFEQSIQEFPKEEMLQMRLRNFLLFESLPYDVFIEVGQNKYGKIISKNKFYSHKIIQNYSKKNVKFLHIKKNEHFKLLDSSIKNFITIFSNKQSDKSKLIKLHVKAIFFIQEYIRSLSVSDDVNALTHLLSNSISDYVRSGNTKMELYFKEVETIKSPSFAEVSMLSSYLCELILIEMKWNSEMTKEKLVLASILQDIHLSNEELYKIRSINDPALTLYTEEEQKVFFEHPKRAQEIARLFQGYTEADFILKEHHEHPSGEGFPSKLNTSNLTTISCIFILATHFISRVVQAENGLGSVKEILNAMKKSYNLGNFKEPMTALIKVFN